MKAFIVLVILAATTQISFGHQTHSDVCHPNECFGSADLRCRIRYSSCTTGICRCDNGYEWSIEKRSCVEVTTTGETCRVQAECPTGTRCSDNYKCECDPNFTTGVFMDDSKACRDTSVLKILGEACTADSDCYSYFDGNFQNSAECSSLICACPATGYTTDGIACIAINYIVGTACDNDNQCPGAFNDPKSGSCASSTCQCDSGYTSVMEGRDCRKPIIALDKECEAGNSTHGCEDKLTCVQCSGALFPICTVDNGAPRSVFGLTSTVTGALMAFVLRNHMLG